MKKLKIYEGGSSELKSYNPYDGGTIEFSGKSHEKGGIKMAYGGHLAEVEGGETAVPSPDGGLMIMGNMTIPGTKTKFKQASKAIAKKEKHYQKILDKGSELVDTHNTGNKFDRLKFKTGYLLMDGASMGQLDLATKKQDLSALQQAMLDTANEMGIDPIKMSEGKVKKFKAGGKLKADAGLGFDTEDPFVKRVKQAIGAAESNNNYNARNPKPGVTTFGKYQFVKATRRGIWEKHLKSEFKTFDDFEKAYASKPEVQEAVMDNHIADLRKQYGDNIEAIALVHRLGPKGYERVKKNPKLLDMEISKSVPESTDKETPNQYLKKILGDTPKTTTEEVAAPQSPQYQPIGNRPAADPDTFFGNPDMSMKTANGKGVPEDDTEYFYNTGKRKAPFMKTPFDPMQIAPEIFAVATNRVRSVPMQQYSPDLFEQYNVSFQDRLNENQATFNAAQRIAAYNPALMGNLTAQKYSADSQVGAEEFRTNQAIQNEITNKNVALLNDAQLKNLQIADQQMVRQSQARSNTRETLQNAINSVASKYLQHKGVNSELQFYQELFDYRPTYNDKGEYTGLQYMGPEQTFGRNPQAGGTGSINSEYQSRMVQKKLPDGSTERINTPSLADQQLKKMQLMQKSSPNKFLKLFGIKKSID